MEGTPVIQFRSGSLLDPLRERARGGSLALAAKRDLERYYGALRLELARLPFSEQELLLLLDAVNGWASPAEPVEIIVQGLRWQVQDAIEQEGLDQKWGVNGAALVERLRQLTPTQTLALVDALERVWLRADDGDLVDALHQILGGAS